MTVNVSKEAWMALRIIVSTSLDTYGVAVERLIKEHYPDAYAEAQRRVAEIGKKHHEGTDSTTAVREGDLLAGRRRKEKTDP